MDLGLAEADPWSVRFRCGCAWLWDSGVITATLYYAHSGFRWESSCQGHLALRRHHRSLRRAVKRSRKEPFEYRRKRAAVMVTLGWPDDRIRGWTKLSYVEIDNVKRQQRLDANILKYEPRLRFREAVLLADAAATLAAGLMVRRQLSGIFAGMPA